MTFGDTWTPLVTQPDRLAVPRSTRWRFQGLFALDAAVLAGALGLVAAGVAVGVAAGAIMILVAAMMGAAATVGLSTGMPRYKALNLAERRHAPLLSCEARDGFIMLAPGPTARRSRQLLVVPGETVTVDVAPDLRHSLFYVVVALKWTISTGGRSIKFSTYFEPDPECFGEVGAAFASVGLHPMFTYRPLSHSVFFADM